jgi:hypothetical protein
MSKRVRLSLVLRLEPEDAAKLEELTAREQLRAVESAAPGDTVREVGRSETLRRLIRRSAEQPYKRVEGGLT